MKKKSTLLTEFNGKLTFMKGTVVILLVSSLFWVGCYEWNNIIQPDSATVNSYFDVFLSAHDDGNPDNDWTNEDLVDYGLLGIMLPNGWTVQDSIAYTIVCTDPSYNNTGILIYNEARSQTLSDSIPPPPGYYWWGSATSTEATMIYFDSLYMEPRINTGSQAGDYFIRYAIGDVDYWDRNPADDISDPMPITLVDNTGLAELLSESNITIFPNPVVDQMSIKLDRYNNELIEMEVVDLTGKVVSKTTVVSQLTKINTENLKAGVYFVRLLNGETSSVHKIIIN